jgi:tryptophan 7-halogenase
MTGIARSFSVLGSPVPRLPDSPGAAHSFWRPSSRKRCGYGSHFETGAGLEAVVLTSLEHAYNGYRPVRYRGFLQYGPCLGRWLLIHSILVVGGGSAGLLTALILKKTCPELKITVVRSSEIGVIGVGESTTAAIPRVLHGYLELDPGDFHRRVLPSWKLGIRFLWGPREFFDYTFSHQLDCKFRELNRSTGYYCDDDLTYVGRLSALMSHDKAFARQENGLPLIQMNYGYHIENRRFVAYLDDMAGQRGITVQDGVITEATRDDHGITGVLLTSGQSLSADLYVDCSGFRSLLIGKALKEPFTSFASTLFCDRAVVGVWKRGEEVIRPYTTAETMSAGWCWQIDHPDYINRGYVYSSSFIDDDQAEAEFRAKNPKVSDTWVVRFVSGRFDRTWVQNVVAIGNAGGFVEPLESTALAIICDAARILAGCLDECDWSLRPSYVHHYNQLISRVWDSTRDFLGIHYMFNTRYDTPFWKAARADTVLGPVQELIDFYQENGPSTFFLANLLQPNSLFGVEGYLALLVGQKVPYRARYAPTAEEQRLWQGFQAGNRTLAQGAVGVREALDVVSRPDIKWHHGFFNTLTRAQLTSYVDTVQ